MAVGLLDRESSQKGELRRLHDSNLFEDQDSEGFEDDSDEDFSTSDRQPSTILYSSDAATRPGFHMKPFSNHPIQADCERMSESHIRITTCSVKKKPTSRHPGDGAQAAKAILCVASRSRARTLLR
jgi:hypothetical protein